MQRMGNPSTLSVRMHIGAAIVEGNIELPQKLKMELPYDPETPLLGIFPKKPETLV